MTTFQAIVYAIIQGVTAFLPVSASAHHILIPFLVGWQQPTPALLNGLTMGSALALFIYFRHDWASMISCLLQVIIYRKRPMTLDERLPLFIGVTNIPLFIAFYYFRPHISEQEWTPLIVASILALGGLALLTLDSMGRKIKGMFDWKWLDAIVVGITLATGILPGWDLFSGALLGSFFMNYKREPAAKFAYFVITPLFIFKTISSLEDVSFGTSAPSSDLTWLSYIIAVLISCLVGLLTMGGLMKNIQQKGMTQYVIYRILLAASVFGTLWMRTH